MKNSSTYKHTNNTEANTASNPEKEGNDSAIDLEFTGNLISEAILSSEKIKDKSSFFILGRSGAGKSTTVNYLLGAKMEREIKKDKKKCGIKKESEKITKGEFDSSESESEDDTTLEKNKIDYQAPIKVVGKEFAKIGHTTKSETIFPSIIPKEANTDFLFCDCPGFLDNRDPAYRVAISFGTELSVKASKEIRGLLICIPYDDLMDTRAQNLRVVVKTLANLFKRTPSVDSMVFFITRVGDKKQKEVIKKVRGAIKKLAKEYDSDLKKIGDVSHATIKQVKEAKQLSNLLNFLRLLLVKDKLVVVDILHEGIGMTREAVLKKIEELSPIKKENFKFNTFDPKRKEFLDQLNSYASNKCELFQNLEHNLKEAKVAFSEIKRLENNIELLEKLKREADTLEEKKEKGKEIENAVIELKKQKEEKRINLKLLEGESDKLIKEINKMKSNFDEVLIYNEDFYENRHFLGFLGYSNYFFKINVPSFSQVRKNKSANGVWESENKNGCQGKYSVTYKSGYYENGYAEINLYEKQNKISNFKKDIESKENKLQLIKKSINQENTNIVRLSSDIKYYESELGKIKTEVQEGLLEIDKNYNKDLEKNKNKTKESEKEFGDKIKNHKGFKEELKAAKKKLALSIFVSKELENINVRDYSKFSNITDVIYNLISHGLVYGKLYSSIVSFYNKFSTQKKEINYLYKKGEINDLQLAFNKIKKLSRNKNNIKDYHKLSQLLFNKISRELGHTFNELKTFSTNKNIPTG